MTQTIPVRHRVVFVSFLVSALLYIDRFVLTYVQTYVRDDLGLTQRQAGWLLSAFFWSYALAQVPSGWLTDRYGPRRMLTLYVIAWSAGTALMGWVYGFAMLLATRLAIGIAQAGAYPACASVVGRWVPVQSRGIANAIVTFGGRLGSGITPMVTAMLLMAFAGGSSSTAISVDDILVPGQLADQMAFAGSGSVPVRATEENETRLTILRRISLSLTDAERDDVARQSGAYQELVGVGDVKLDSPAKRFGAPPPDRVQSERTRNSEFGVSDRPLWQAILQRATEGDLLASTVELERIPVEREARRDILSSTLTPEQRQRINRLILEATLPGSIRQLYSQGWRSVMLIYALLGVVIAGGYWFVVRNRPADHPRITEAELAIIEEGRPAAVAASGVDRLPMRAILTSRSLWLISLLQLCTNIGWTFLVLQLPEYLQKVQHCSLESRSFHSSVPIWAGWIGMFLGGWFTDWCARRMGLRLGRMIPLSGTRFLAAGAFVVLMFTPSLWVATAMFSLVAFSTDVGVPAVWAYNQDVGGRYIASVLGWGNMWGNIGSALSPLIVVEALSRSGTWKFPFGICAAAFVAAGLCGLLIDATKPIDGPEIAK
jgi:nitrate/nitrite transporter NarK